MAALLIQWFEAIIARLVMLPYQYGMVLIGDPKRTYVSWWSTDPAQMVPIENFNNVVSLYVCGLGVWHYVFSMFNGCLAIGAERFFATMFIHDYERTSRKYIPICLILIDHSITIPLAYFMINNRIEFLPIAGMCLFIMISVLMMFFTLWMLNTRLQKKIEDPKRRYKYSLGQQFQVKENIRCLEMAKTMVFVVSLSVIALSILLICLVLGIIPYEFVNFSYRILENSVYVCPIVICTGVMFSADSWRDHFLKGFPLVGRIRCCVKLKGRKMEKELNETEVYFNHLKNSWI